MIATSSVRVVVPIPPKQWFGGQDRRGVLAVFKSIQERFGTTFYQLDTTPFANGDIRKQKDAIENLRAYRPHLAISQANYALLSSVRSGEGRANIFTDVLKIPLMMIWDHGLFAFPSMILSPLAERAEDSRPGSLHKVCEVIDTPMMHHFPIDTGQVAEMRRIGMMHSEQVETVPAMAYDSFLDFGLNERSGYINDVAFFGNVLLSDQYRLITDTSIAGRCREAVISAKLATPSAPAWNLLVERVEALSSHDRTESRLDYDQSFFWHFANNLVGVHCNTQSRMQVLENLRRKVAFYGAFADPGGIPRLKESGHIDFKGDVHFSNELPRAYAGTRITVDVTNAAFITNCSTKPICCFASGGFALFDYKPDPVNHLGSDVEKVMFRTFDELNAKIDYFLTNEREREALGDHLRDMIRRKCNFTDSVHDPAVRILAERAGSGIWASLKEVSSRVFGGLSGRTAVPLQVDDETDSPAGSTRRLAELAKVPEIETAWRGAKLVSESPVQIRTADAAWGYSALFPLPRRVQRRGAHVGLWIEAKVRMISGRAGIGVMLDDGALVEERLLGIADGPRTVFLPLRATGQRGLLIRSVEEPGSILELADVALVADSRFGTRKGMFTWQHRRKTAS